MAGLADRLPVRERTVARGALAFPRVELAGIRTWPLARQVLLCVVALFLAKQILNVFVFPPFSGHDEVAHYSYVRTVATGWRVPRIVGLQEFRDWIGSGGTPPGDYFSKDLYKYCRYVLQWNFCNEPRWKNNPPMIVTYAGAMYPHGWQYAANHPPLYYLAMTPLYKISEGTSPATQQYLLRAAMIPVGLSVVLLAYAIVRLLFPADPFLAITVPAFVALQPQISYEGAMVNNDMAGIAVYSLLLYLLVRGLRRGFSWQLTAGIGFTLGVGLLIKSTTLAIVPVIAFATIFGVGPRNWKSWVPRGAAMAGLAGLVAWPWYLYLYRTYGNLSALPQIADLQYGLTYRAGEAPSIVSQLVDKDFAALRWRETWGEFGWRLIQLDDRLLWAIGIPCIIATAGLIGYLVAIAARWRPSRSGSGTGVGALEQSQVIGIATMLLAAVVAYGAMLQFGTQFRLTQARYFFPAIIAFAFLLMLGLRALTPASAQRYVAAAVVGGLVLLNILIYSQYVLPFWYLPS